MDILINNTSEIPIYRQIKDQIKDAIYTGQIKEGEILPSIRKLANETMVSVLTTKRAYDELEAEEPVTWSYQLHTVTNPMNVNKTREYVHIRATSKDGASDAYLFSSGTLETDTTSRFFVPAVNWLRADEKGHFAPYPNHWHFTATSDKQKVYRFATIVYTHAKENDAENAQAAPRKLKDGSIQIGDWNIKANISTAGKPSFEVRNTRKDCDASISYKDYGATVIHDNGKKTELKDEVPELEI